MSHNSYSQAVAARSLRLPVMTAMDYEYQPANHLAFRCADLVAVPEAFPLDRLLAQGARPGRTWRYPGLKEHIALAGFTPDPGYLARAGIDASRPVVVVRPPADMALYHRFTNPLFPLLLERLASAPVTTILLARTGAQAADLEAAGFGALLWRGEALDGRQLVAGADAVVSAGGSMNREAAVLGTPARRRGPRSGGRRPPASAPRRARPRPHPPAQEAGRAAAVDRRRPHVAVRRPAPGGGAAISARQMRLLHVAGAPTLTKAAPHRRTGGALTFLVTH